MTKIFEKEYNLRAADFDCWQRLRPASIMDLFQDAAGIHASLLGVGTNELARKNTVWVLVKQRFRICSDAAMYQKVKLRTWPLPPDRVGYRREYLVLDEQDNIIVEGSSEWVLMDFDARKIVPAGDIYPLESYCEDKNFTGRFPRVRSFEATLETPFFTPPWSDFDINGHVNNTKYPNYVLDAISPGKNEVLRSLCIEYHREILPGENISLSIRREGGSVLARGENSLGEKMFSCSMEFAES